MGMRSVREQCFETYMEASIVQSPFFFKFRKNQIGTDGAMCAAKGKKHRGMRRKYQAHHVEINMR